jgi:hypothetical protein
MNDVISFDVRGLDLSNNYVHKLNFSRKYPVEYFHDLKNFHGLKNIYIEFIEEGIILMSNNGNIDEFIKFINEGISDSKSINKEGYCEYLNECNYNSEEYNILKAYCEKYTLNLKKIRVHKSNKYNLKTGYAKGTFKNLKKIINTDFKIKEGIGGGGRGAQGFKVEEDVNNEINIVNSNLRNKILNHIPEYKRDKVLWISKNHIENTRRKIKIENNTINFENNTSRNISDMKIHFKDLHHGIAGILFISDEYISQKSSGLVTFINCGIQKECFNEEEMKQNNITDKGKTLLEVLGLDVIPFCSIFNNYSSGNKSINKDIAELYNKEIKFNSVDNIILKNRLEDLVKKSMGEGTSIISHRLNGEDIIYKNKDKNINILKYNSYYGGKTSKAKRIDVFIETDKIRFNFNIRNKAGQIYPSHIMCDFSYIS